MTHHKSAQSNEVNITEWPQHFGFPGLHPWSGLISYSGLMTDHTWLTLVIQAIGHHGYCPVVSCLCTSCLTRMLVSPLFFMSCQCWHTSWSWVKVDIMVKDRQAVVMLSVWPCQIKQVKWYDDHNKRGDRNGFQRSVKAHCRCISLVVLLDNSAHPSHNLNSMVWLTINVQVDR